MEVAQTPIYVLTHSLLKSHFTHNFSDPQRCEIDIHSWKLRYALE